jgi:hypothetical protein
MDQFPLPELLQKIKIGTLGKTDVYVKPLTTTLEYKALCAHHPLKSFVHLSVVDEDGEYFTEEDFVHMDLSRGAIEYLWNFCREQYPLIVEHYLKRLEGGTIIVRTTRVCIDVLGFVFVEFILHEPLK